MKTILLILPSLSKKLSKGLFSATLLYCNLLYFLISRKLFNSTIGKDYKLKIYLNGEKRNFYLTHPVETVGLREAFVDEEYNWFPKKDYKIVIDLGAHIGDTALYYHKQFPDAKIIAVEASPHSFEQLVKNTAGIKQIIPVKAAIGSEDGKIEFSIQESSLGSSIKERSNTSETITVNQISLKSLFFKHSVKRADIIKYDIEGAEFDLFNNIQVEGFADSYIGEVHFDLGGTDLESYLKTFSKFENSSHQLGRDRYVVKSVIARERMG